MMENRSLGRLWPVSVLTIGGGGLGHVWGPTSRAEEMATLREAVDSGITLIEVAPTYGNGEAERVVGEAFRETLLEGVRVLTKYHVGNAAPAEVEDGLIRSLDESLAG
jgi:aryl-alcohol dehydrogenase-like predicted oxidoreductase